MNGGLGQQNGTTLCLLTNPSSAYITSRIRVWRHLGDRLLNCWVMNHHSGPAPGIMVWSGIEFLYRTPPVRFAGTLHSQPYISEVFEPVVLPYIQCFSSAIFQQHNAQPRVARNVEEFCFNQQIKLLP
ncbi:transposable element Tcb1 transposase [Trichonephila clavipes]|nr:transposable element Tcb1 transposase [Trichonephila clavipes]